MVAPEALEIVFHLYQGSNKTHMFLNSTRIKKQNPGFPLEAPYMLFLVTALTLPPKIATSLNLSSN